MSSPLGSMRTELAVPASAHATTVFRLHPLTQLTSITISRPSYIPDLMPLVVLSQLKRLHLGALTGLEALSLAGFKWRGGIRSKHLAAMSHIRVLDLRRSRFHIDFDIQDIVGPLKRTHLLVLTMSDLSQFDLGVCGYASEDVDWKLLRKVDLTKQGPDVKAVCDELPESLYDQMNTRKRMQCCVLVNQILTGLTAEQEATDEERLEIHEGRRLRSLDKAYTSDFLAG
ncbi:hypothetical protein WJX73_007675 [Symbiochloris irregularis]|uniref:Uncharacterized protein n=1 Tax=Symbiochloris irregularis TaxID=706552 RepID=A0AAW1PDP9_9CHLO